MDERDLISRARELTEPESVSLENELSVEPTNIDQRALLLIYYQLLNLKGGNENSLQFIDKKIGEHVLWIINHVPEHEFAHSPFTRYDSKTLTEVWRSAWEEQLKSDSKNVNIIENVACFYIGIDINYSLELFFKAAKIEPDNPHWSVRCEFVQGLIAEQ
jgi:hypothetical protein